MPFLFAKFTFLFVVGTQSCGHHLQISWLH